MYTIAPLDHTIWREPLVALFHIQQKLDLHLLLKSLDSSILNSKVITCNVHEQND